MEKMLSANPRALAMKSLLSMERDGKYANLEVSASLNRSRLSEADRGLYTALVYGVIERSITLDFILSGLSKRPVSELDEEVRMAAKLGLYQLLFMDRIPDHAAVSESVSLVKGPSRGFVNAILRNFLRGGKTWQIPKDLPASKRLSLTYSTPEPLCALFLEQYGEETAEALLASFLSGQERVAVRVNPLKTSPEALRKKLEAAGETVRVSNISSDMLCLTSAKTVISSYIGECFVEDEASRMAVRQLELSGGEVVVDVCAAPGGKTFSAALDMGNRGALYAFDLHKNKLSLIESGAEKLGISILKTEARDARVPNEALFGKADAVLCDAPCSGLGVIGKKPDVKYKDLASLEELPGIQQAILKGASAYVKAGGRLVYSTCTLNGKENGEVVRAFLKDHPSFELITIPHPVSGARLEQGMMTLLPQETGTDGFFIAVMRRRQEANE